jgi:hypothetical protein
VAAGPSPPTASENAETSERPPPVAMDRELASPPRPGVTTPLALDARVPPAPPCAKSRTVTSLSPSAIPIDSLAASPPTPPLDGAADASMAPPAPPKAP